MKIEQITLRTHTIEKMKSFYNKTLGLTLLYEDKERFCVAVGSNKLEFTKEGVKGRPYYHFAFNIHSTRSEENFTELVVPIRKVISLAGVTDLKQMWEIHKMKGIKSPVVDFIGGSPAEVASRYEISSPIELVSKDIEQVLIHGELDLHVPVQQSIDYYEKLKAQRGNVSLVVLEDVEHFNIIDSTSTAWKSVINSI